MKSALIILMLLIADPTFSSADNASPPATQPSAIDAVDSLAFQDPSVSVTTRLGGSARGGKTADEVFLFVSTHPGRTINPHPTIYWYLTADTEADIDLVVSEPGVAAPFYRNRLTGKMNRGLHAFSLDRAPSELQTGVQYKVTAMVWENANDPSVNPFSSGYIERVTPPAGLAGNFDDRSIASYNAAHLWYDTLDALSHRIDKDPANPHLRNQRLSLVRDQHIFLGFSAPAIVEKDIEPAIDQASDAAKAREKQLLGMLTEDDRTQINLTR